MNIFEFFNIPDTNPIYLLNNRFYCYKNIIVDLQDNIHITLQAPTENNTLLKQLNIPFIINNVEYKYSLDDLFIYNEKPITYANSNTYYVLSIPYKELDLTILYFQSIDNSWFIAHLDKYKNVTYYKSSTNAEYKDILPIFIKNLVYNRLIEYELKKDLL